MEAIYHPQTNHREAFLGSDRIPSYEAVIKYARNEAILASKAGIKAEVGIEAVRGAVRAVFLRSQKYQKALARRDDARAHLNSLPEKARELVHDSGDSGGNPAGLSHLFHTFMLLCVLMGAGVLLTGLLRGVMELPWMLSLGIVGSIFLFSTHTRFLPENRLEELLYRWGIPIVGGAFVGSLLAYWKVPVWFAVLSGILGLLFIRVLGNVLSQVFTGLPEALKAFRYRRYQRLISRRYYRYFRRLAKAEQTVERLNRMMTQFEEAAGNAFLMEYYLAQQVRIYEVPVGDSEK